MPDFFSYRDGELFAEAVPVARIAKEVGTPPERPLICYAVKANANLAVLRVFGRLGAGADVVSQGELRRALAAGIPPQRIIFSGVGKTGAELEAGLTAGIHQINVESVPELQRLSAIAAARGDTARIAIRVNPDVDALTHAKIATGKKENKFGIDIEEAGEAYRLAGELPGIEPVGLAVHIGSQTGGGLGPFREAFERLAELVLELRGAGFAVHRLDLGGGDLAFEPGRVLCGSAGLMVARVVYVKEGASRRFLILDAAMNDLIRPALYDAWHDIVPVRLPAPGAVLSPADVVGPVCETGDTFATERDLPPLAEDDLVAFTGAGAYGAVMSSTYNSRLLIPEVLAEGGRFAVIRARPSYDAMLALDAVPDWLAEPKEEPTSLRAVPGGGK